MVSDFHLPTLTHSKFFSSCPLPGPCNPISIKSLPVWFVVSALSQINAEQVLLSLLNLILLQLIDNVVIHNLETFKK